MDKEIRNLALYAIGWILYIAASPDTADGLSDEDFTLLQQEGPTLIAWYLLLQNTSILDKSLQLPPNFDTHFKNVVLPGLNRIRSNGAEREYFRAEVMIVLVSPELLNKLYTPGGDTYSDMIERAEQRT